MRCALTRSRTCMTSTPQRLSSRSSRRWPGPRWRSRRAGPSRRLDGGAGGEHCGGAPSLTGRDASGCVRSVPRTPRRGKGTPHRGGGAGVRTRRCRRRSSPGAGPIQRTLVVVVVGARHALTALGRVPLARRIDLCHRPADHLPRLGGSVHRPALPAQFAVPPPRAAWCAPGRPCRAPAPRAGGSASSRCRGR